MAPMLSATVATLTTMMRVSPSSARAARSRRCEAVAPAR